ncbi:MAG: shikimate kinase AroK [Gammaproteobacteria bacterium]|jgi:shikimate kinase
MNKHNKIFLIGPMGAGKTTIGKQLAETQSLQFLDSDHEIETRTGVTIPHIFDVEGEEGFRRREENMIDELTQKQNIVLATGGGAVIREINRQHLKDRGTVIYLHAGIEQLLERTARDKNRPLLQTVNPRAKLEELMAVREPLYREVADIIIDTEEQPVAKVVKHILQKLQELPA